MRRTIIRLVILATALTAFGGASPSTAAASSCYHDRVTLDACAVTMASPRYTGWTYLESTCPSGAQCFWAGAIGAWRWNGRSWSQTTLRAAQWVYVYPYTGEWRWAWTQQTGWVATNEGRFALRRY